MFVSTLLLLRIHIFWQIICCCVFVCTICKVLKYSSFRKLETTQPVTQDYVPEDMIP